MDITNQNSFLASAFISCSLRQEDRPFVDFAESILIDHQIKPFGTVGWYDAAPMSTAELMKQNIPFADMIIIVATPRYLQKDIKTEQTSSGISEMLHVESGMAYAYNKPIIAFVQEGTNVGNFLPNITQYIILNGTEEDLKQKWGLINHLLNHAYQISQYNKSQASSDGLRRFFTSGLAVWGGYKILESIAEYDKPRTRPRKRLKIKK